MAHFEEGRVLMVKCKEEDLDLAQRVPQSLAPLERFSFTLDLVSGFQLYYALGRLIELFGSRVTIVQNQRLSEKCENR